jgi:hypothetical protein
MFVTLKKDHLGHKAGAALDVHEEPIARSQTEQGVAEAVQGDPYAPSWPGPCGPASKA